MSEQKPTQSEAFRTPEQLAFGILTTAQEESLKFLSQHFETDTDRRREGVLNNVDGIDMLDARIEMPIRGTEIGRNCHYEFLHWKQSNRYEIVRTSDDGVETVRISPLMVDGTPTGVLGTAWAGDPRARSIPISDKRGALSVSETKFGVSGGSNEQRQVFDDKLGEDLQAFFGKRIDSTITGCRQAVEYKTNTSRLKRLGNEVLSLLPHRK